MITGTFALGGVHTLLYTFRGIKNGLYRKGEH